MTRERLNGYRQAAGRRGMRPQRRGRGRANRGNALTSENQPDAIAAMGDQVAAVVVRAAQSAGRDIPDDVAVTGWDDSAVAAQLELTTVAQSLREQGAACACAALGQIPTPQAAPWSIVRRGSTRT